MAVARRLVAWAVAAAVIATACASRGVKFRVPSFRPPKPDPPVYNMPSFLPKDAHAPKYNIPSLDDLRARLLALQLARLQQVQLPLPNAYKPPPVGEDRKAIANVTDVLRTRWQRLNLSKQDPQRPLPGVQESPSVKEELKSNLSIADVLRAWLQRPLLSVGEQPKSNLSFVNKIRARWLALDLLERQQEQHRSLPDVYKLPPDGGWPLEEDHKPALKHATRPYEYVPRPKTALSSTSVLLLMILLPAAFIFVFLVCALARVSCRRRDAARRERVLLPQRAVANTPSDAGPRASGGSTRCAPRAPRRTSESGPLLPPSAIPIPLLLAALSRRAAPPSPSASPLLPNATSRPLSSVPPLSSFVILLSPSRPAESTPPLLGSAPSSASSSPPAYDTLAPRSTSADKAPPSYESLLREGRIPSEPEIDPAIPATPPEPPTSAPPSSSPEPPPYDAIHPPAT